MEIPSSKRVRIFRTEGAIVKLLDEFRNSNVSVKEFCAEKGISPGSFHNWKKKYGPSEVNSVVPGGFTALQVSTSASITEPGLFAEVKGIKIYNPVTAAYLKELLA